MGPEDLNKTMLSVASYLYEGSETAALDLLFSCVPEFVPKPDQGPDTFVLHGPRKLIEAFEQKATASVQITKAFEVTHPEPVTVRVRYRPINQKPPAWRHDLVKELPQIGALDAEFETC